MRYLAILVLLGSPAMAQEFIPKASDRVLDQAAMAAEVIGRTHTFFDEGVSFFSVTGIYTYTYSDGRRAYGSWVLPETGADGVICTNFDAGFSRCDMYVHDGTRLVLITQDGTRFPVKAAR